MIHWDTNALIALPAWMKAGHPLVARVLAGEPTAINAVVWYEFLNGPLADDEAAVVHAFVRGSIAAVTEQHAALAAELFNGAGRRRTLKTDALIAAVAICAKADFVTLNMDDFKPFVGTGLRLVDSNA